MAATSRIQHTPRLVARTAIAAGVLFAVLTVLVTTGATQAFDTAVLTWVHGSSSPWLNSVVPELTHVGEPLLVGVVAAIAALAFMLARRYTSATLIFCGVIGALSLNHTIKTIVGRARPELWERLVNETGYSFTSGHATASAALALGIVAILWHTKWRRLSIVIATLYIVLIAFTRLYLGVHYPSDIIGGWLTAAAWVGVVVLLATRPARGKKVPTNTTTK